MAEPGQAPFHPEGRLIVSSDRFEATEACARRLDDDDPLASYRDCFHIPPGPGGGDSLYFTGNSLGLMPKAAEDAVQAVLKDWREGAVAAHFDADYPWMPYHHFLRAPLARLMGTKPTEVVAMNSLTVNLHLMMVSFYRPTPSRHRIVIEKGAFPSDRHAMASQLAWHGYDPEEGLVELAPRDGENHLREEDVEAWLDAHGGDVALVLWPGVQFRTGQFFDLDRIVQASHRNGTVVGLDLAHAAGNLPLSLHDSGCDFAVWCSYKYLNSGPGAVAGCFVHERHGQADLPRFAGWWGHDEKTRFRMGPEFDPMPGADGWQLSNPPILAMAPLRASLEIFDQASIKSLRKKSFQLTGFLEFLLRNRLDGRVEILTPSDPKRRGCQLSLRVRTDDPRQVFRQLEHRGVVCDWREPDVIRAAPVPLYNRFMDVFRFVEILDELLK